jgi:hypothetical protein
LQESTAAQVSAENGSEYNIEQILSNGKELDAKKNFDEIDNLQIFSVFR